MIKRGRWRSKEYLAHVRTYACLKCQSPWPSAHHVTYAQTKGMSLKVGDEWAVPLCHTCHMHLHAHPPEKLWWAIIGVDPLEWCRTTHGNWEGSGE